MKVKVSPPYEGAGSWESEVVLRRPVKIAMDGEVIIAHLLKGGVQVPASWCEPIPEITSEEGDIVEDFDGDIFVVAAEAGGIYYRENGCSILPFRVLARKPKGFEAMKPTTYKFLKEYSHAETQEDMQAAYERFLSAILGVPYGRVEG